MKTQDYPLWLLHFSTSSQRIEFIAAAVLLSIGEWRRNKPGFWSISKRQIPWYIGGAVPLYLCLSGPGSWALCDSWLRPFARCSV
jgi:hypothetical protein